jgi:two-component system response regulator HydG
MPGWGPALPEGENVERKANILVVDDHPSTALIVALILECEGYAVATARDGLEAVERVKASPFDVILMDIRMPRMDGLTAYREIKAIRPQVAVILMTAYAVEEQVQEALREGIREIVRKPLDFERVISLIEEHKGTGQSEPGIVAERVPDAQET